MTRSARFVPVLILALLMLFPAVLVAAWAPADRPGIPVAGHRSEGIGYCVTLEGSGVFVKNDTHVVSAKARKRKGLPPLETAEFIAGVRNALFVAARNSGKPELLAAVSGSIAFPELGIPITDAASIICTCATSGCYGLPPGTKCTSTKCDGSCADCENCISTGHGSGMAQYCSGENCDTFRVPIIE
jgi:hypothetical protein